MRWIRVGLLVMIALLCIPRTVHAQEQGYILFYHWDEHGEAVAMTREFEFLQDPTTQGKATILFNSLFHCLQDHEITYVPEGTQLLNAEFQDGIIKLSLSKEAANCYGGEAERLFSQQILKTAYSIEEIQGIIVLVDGRELNLPEGTQFMSRAEEQKNGQYLICNPK